MAAKSLWHVYALKDPRDGAIRYIGKSQRPKARLKYHLGQDASRPMRQWVQELRGQRPMLEIVKSYAWEADAAAAERSLIGELRDGGHALVNVRPGGERLRDPHIGRFFDIDVRLRTTRMARGLDQLDLARASGVSQSAISKIESGTAQHFSAESAVLLARAVDVSAEWLVTGKERQTKKRGGMISPPAIGRGPNATLPGGEMEAEGARDGLGANSTTPRRRHGVQGEPATGFVAPVMKQRRCGVFLGGNS